MPLRRRFRRGVYTPAAGVKAFRLELGAVFHGNLARDESFAPIDGVGAISEDNCFGGLQIGFHGGPEISECRQSVETVANSRIVGEYRPSRKDCDGRVSVLEWAWIKSR